MAVELLMRLDPSGAGLVPATPQEEQTMLDLAQVGGLFRVLVKQDRTNKFHRKGMALFRFLFNLWEPVVDTANGAPIAKDFDAFRGNLTIKAGYYTQVFNLDGGFELKPVSINWKAMDNIQFSQVYSHVIDVGLQMLGKADHLTPDEVDAAVAELLRFA